MTGYTLRNLDPDLWGAVLEKVRREGTTIRWVLVRLLQLWVEGDLDLREPPREIL